LEERHADTRGWLNESRAYTLALRIASTPGYRVLEVRRAWSAAVAWQVEAAERRTGARLLLLSDDQFDGRLMGAAQPDTDGRLMGAAQPDTGEITTAQVAPIVKRAAAHHS